MGKSGIPTTNPELHKAMMELRRSNAAVPFNAKTKERSKSKKAKTQDELKTYDNTGT